MSRGRREKVLLRQNWAKHGSIDPATARPASVPGSDNSGVSQARHGADSNPGEEIDGLHRFQESGELAEDPRNPSVECEAATEVVPNATKLAGGKTAAASGELASPTDDSEPSAMIMKFASIEACDADQSLPNEAKKFLVVNAEAFAIVNSGVAAEGCCVLSGDGGGS